MGVLADYFLNSSLHGLHFIADRRFHWTERVFWTLCVLASWGASLLLILNATEQYRSQKISFTVDTSYLDWKTNFPAIVVCEKSNNLDEPNIRLFGENVEHFPKLESFVFYDGTFRYKEKCQVGGAFRDRCLLGNYSYYMNKYRSTCHEVFTRCSYSSDENQFPCCEYFLPIPTYHGPCFAINSLLANKQSNADELFKIDRHHEPGYGYLSIELSKTSFYIYAMSQDAVPTKDSSKEYALIQSAIRSLADDSYYKAFLAIEETFTDENTRLLNVENRGCRFNDENNLQFSDIYSTSTCENECLINAQLEICNCSAHTLPHNNKVKECDYDSLICIMDNKKILQRSKSCKCTSSCFEVNVMNLGSTKTKVPRSMFLDEQSKVRIDFIAQPPTIRYTRSVVKNPLTMLVGGTAGLFLGASLLTIVEIFYYIIIRPLGDKYLKKQKEKLLIQSKQQHMDFFDGCYFEYVN